MKRTLSVVKCGGLLISVALVVLCRVRYLGSTGVEFLISPNEISLNRLV